MAYQPSQKLVDYAIIAAIIGGAYVVWSKFFATAPEKTCPVGQHYVDVCADAGTGLGKWLCNAGRNILGGSSLDCVADECSPGYEMINGVCTLTDSSVIPPDVPILDSYGCVVGIQRWCPVDGKCMDNAKYCTPPPELIPSPGSCYEWSPTFAKYIYSPGLPGCDPYTNPDPGDPCAVSECTPGVTACFEGVSKRCVSLGTGCEDRGIWSLGGSACSPVTNIVDCGNGCGLVDLNNPPGTTCEQVCSSIWTPGCVQDYNECLRLQQVNPGGQLRGFMNAAACAAMGGQPEAGGYCRNQAARDLDALRAAACCW